MFDAAHLLPGNIGRARLLDEQQAPRLASRARLESTARSRTLDALP